MPIIGTRTDPYVPVRAYGSYLEWGRQIAHSASGAHERAARESTSESTQLLIRLGARRLGVPAFVINGELWRVGLPPLQVFRDEIDRVHGAASGGE